MFASGERLGFRDGSKITFHCKPLVPHYLLFMVKVKKIMQTTEDDKVILQIVKVCLNYFNVYITL